MFGNEKKMQSELDQLNRENASQHNEIESLNLIYKKLNDDM